MNSHSVDPNARKIQKNAIYQDKTQHAHFWGNPLFRSCFRMLAVFLVAYFFLPDIVGRFGSEFQTDGAIKLGKWANWPEVVFLPKSVIYSNRNKMIPLPCPPPPSAPLPSINLFVTGWLVIQQSRVSPVGVCAFERHILETNGAEVVVLAVVDEGGGRVLESLFQLAQGILRRQP